ncbi:MAG: TrkH family potassium uptake protein [Deltaproteobacteria bacterium]
MTRRSSYSGRARVHPTTLSSVRRVGYLLSLLLVFASLTLAVPLAISAGYGEPETVGDFSATLLIGVVIGLTGYFFLRTDLAGLTRREGFAAVALGWLMVCALGSLPFALAGGLDPVNAWFETVSGFTGTGSSVIPDVEALPKGLLFWRSFTHWLGGMGFVALYIAIFPLMGVGAMQLFRAEAPGLEMDRLRPRIRSTARILWLIYLGMSVALTVLLLAGGMSWFDAVCQMFAAIGTGGFSTKNTSIGWFDSAYIDWVIILFLWIASTNFALWWAVLGGKPKRLLKDPEWRFYSLVLLGSSLVVSALVYFQNHVSLHDAVRNATFEVVSTASTTGFATADYEKWAPLAQLILFLLLFMGGSAGSTAGAMKAVRVYLFGKQALRGLFTTVHPQSVAPVRLGGRAVSPEVMRGISTFMGLYLLTYVVAVAAVSLTDIDFATAMSAVATAMGGVGPGLGEIGPYDNFLWMHPFAKLVLTFCMVAGRLELFTLMLIFVPAYWRR